MLTIFDVIHIVIHMCVSQLLAMSLSIPHHVLVVVVVGDYVSPDFSGLNSTVLLSRPKVTLEHQ